MDNRAAFLLDSMKAQLRQLREIQRAIRSTEAADIFSAVQEYNPPYGSLNDLSTVDLIRASVGDRELARVCGELICCPGATVAVNEINGDYAYGPLVSGWSGFLEIASRGSCDAQDNAAATRSGDWSCHESRLKASRLAIRAGRIVNVRCAGNVRVLSAPIVAHNRPVGTICLACGRPPSGKKELSGIARTFNLSLQEVMRAADLTAPLPLSISWARDRLKLSARTIGLMVDRGMASERLNLHATFSAANPNPVMRITSDWRLSFANPRAQAIVTDSRPTAAFKVSQFWRNIVNETFELGATRSNIEVSKGSSTFKFEAVPDIGNEYVDFYGLDVTAEVAVERKLRYSAGHDRATDLHNTETMLGILDHKLIDAKRDGSMLALLYIDINGFKQINDAFGRERGDELVKLLAARIAGHAHFVDSLARVGADEIAVALKNVGTIDDILELVGLVQEDQKLPIDIDGHKVYVSITIGISFYPGPSATGEKLLENADSAMRTARAQQRSLLFYSQQMEAVAKKRTETAKALSGALRSDQLRLLYQPLLDLETGRIETAEALLRWEHPEKGLLAPDEFISLAEDTGLIIPIGAWVLKEACSQVKSWQEELSSPLKLAMTVNISVRQLHSIDVVRMVSESLEQSNLDPKFLGLEITETTLMKNKDVIGKALRDIKAMGVSIIVDDFGTGYSSLAYLGDLPIDTLKIDRAFVAKVVSGPDAAIIGAIVKMAHTLGMTVVAEGVETAEQEKKLRRLGCDVVQGFFYSRPVDSATFSALLRGEKLWLDGAA